MTDSCSCIICGKDFVNKDALQLHLLRHLGYRRFTCGSCASCFYTEEEREEHCRENSHIHMFEMKLNQYNEMLLRQILKDIDILATYDLDFVIRERSKASMMYEKSVVSSSPSCKKKDKKAKLPPSLPRVEQRVESTKKPEKKSPKRNSSLRDRSRSQSGRDSNTESANEGDEWTTIRKNVDLDRSTNVVSQFEKHLQTEVTELKCNLCKKKVSSEYETRKHHVSANHIPYDHSESDYLDILEDKLRQCFPMWPYSDFQCQFPNCGKVYKSTSSRRYHVLGSHFEDTIDCPFTDCNFSFKDVFKANNHIKDDHDLPDGAKGIRDSVIKYKFEYEKRAHNSKLEKVIKKAFPCPIPPSTPKSTEKAKDILSNIRPIADRRFQNIPPAPRRARSSSSSPSSSSSSEDETPKKTKQSKKKSENSKGKGSTKTQEASKENKEKEKSVEGADDEESSSSRKNTKNSVGSPAQSERQEDSHSDINKKKRNEDTNGNSVNGKRNRNDSTRTFDLKEEIIDIDTDCPSQGSCESHPGTASIGDIKEEIDDYVMEVDSSDYDPKDNVKYEAQDSHYANSYDNPYRKKILLATPPANLRKISVVPKRLQKKPTIVKNARVQKPSFSKVTTIVDTRPSYTLPAPNMCGL